MFSASTADASLIEFNRWHLGLLICYDVEFPRTRVGWLSPAPI